MPTYRFSIHEDGKIFNDEIDYVFADVETLRREAVMAGADIAREVFAGGEVNEVVVDITQDNFPFMTVRISLDVQVAPKR